MRINKARQQQQPRLLHVELEQVQRLQQLRLDEEALQHVGVPPPRALRPVQLLLLLLPLVRLQLQSLQMMVPRELR